MNKKILCICAIAVSTVGIAVAQTSEVKEKPPLYSYVGNWTLPRAQWAEMSKPVPANQAILSKALASGTLVGYGSDTTLIHQGDQSTHDSWWQSMSMAGVLNVLDQFHKAGTSSSPVLASATKHSDNLFVSRYYNWHAGSWKDIYTHGASYKLKADAPQDAVDLVAKNLIVPLMEKMLADGTIHEYEIDTEAIHTEAPGTFWLFYLTSNAEGLDKVNNALQQTMKANPLGGPAFGSMVDFTTHRDSLSMTDASYK